MNLKGVLNSLDNWLKPESPGRITLSAELAEALVEQIGRAHV